MRPRLKVCCIASPDEARLAIAAGADALGLVAVMPSGPGPIDDDRIAEIARAVPPPIATFLLTARTRGEEVVDHLRHCGTNTVQLVDRVDPEAYDEIREALPQVRIVQVIHVTGPESLDEAVAVAPQVDALLLDSGRPDAARRELGGTGRTHDWTLSRRIVETAPCPVFLAGGLRPDNVAMAVGEVQPFGVDLCSGVRSGDRLDADKLQRFVVALEQIAT